MTRDERADQRVLPAPGQRAGLHGAPSQSGVVTEFGIGAAGPAGRSRCPSASRQASCRRRCGRDPLPRRELPAQASAAGCAPSRSSARAPSATDESASQIRGTVPKMRSRAISRQVASDSARQTGARARRGHVWHRAQHLRPVDQERVSNSTMASRRTGDTLRCRAARSR